MKAYRAAKEIPIKMSWASNTAPQMSRTALVLRIATGAQRAAPTAMNGKSQVVHPN